MYAKKFLWLSDKSRIYSCHGHNFNPNGLVLCDVIPGGISSVFYSRELGRDRH